MFCFRLVCTVLGAVAAMDGVGCTTNNGVARTKVSNRVKIGVAVYDLRTRNFEKPWPFGAAAGPGGTFN